MNISKITGAVSVLAIAVLGVLLLPAAVVPEHVLYREVLTPRVVLYIAAPIKVLFLLLAALFASRSGASFDEANPVRRAWILLAMGLWGYGAAQAILASYQMVRTETPFPSLADVFFVPATVLLAVSLFVFLTVYKRVGFPVGSPRDVRVVAAGTLVLLAAFSVVVVGPVLGSDAPVAERTLNVLYPLLDLLMLVPAVLLLRMALQMRGGSLWKVWMELVVGFVFLAAGDILFAFLTTLEQTGLDPVVDLMFAWSYVLMARAASTQYQILAVAPR